MPDATRGGDRNSRCTLSVRGLDCPSEVPAIQAALDAAAGVLDFDVVPADGLVVVTYDSSRTDPTKLARTISESTGMVTSQISDFPKVLRESERLPVRSFPWTATALSGLALAVALGLDYGRGPMWMTKWSYGIAIALAGIELLPKAWRALRDGRLGIHLLVALAVAGAIGLGDWGEAATVAFLFGLSEALESLSLARARKAVRRLLEVAPETAERIEGPGQTRVVSVEEVRLGDRVLVRPGMRVPVDGRVLTGRSSIDQKTITGESVPVARGPGDEVFAGTVNGEGTIEVVAEREASCSVVARTVELVRAAQRSKTPTERTVERFAAFYTPLVFAGALVLMIGPPLVLTSTGQQPGWRDWFGRGLVLLVAACPCALVIGTPVAVVSALAAAARRGILVKGGANLEAVGRLKVMAFDKTGTLTRGEPDVVQVVPSMGADADGVIRIAAALGDRGGHLLGKAIARHAREREIQVPLAEDYRAVPGLGATARVEEEAYHVGSHRYLDESGVCDAGDFHRALGEAELEAGTSVAVSAPGGPLGYIRLADRARPEASAVLAELERLGVRTVMLTGDNRTTAAAMAGELGVKEHRSGLLPEDKARMVAELDREFGPTGMVGDGVNDAPAMAAARVSVALGGISSAAALEAADVVLMSEDLLGLPWLIRHSRKTLARIWQNIGIAIGVKVVVLGLAVLGHADLKLAIAADVGTTLFVVANALRLLKSGR